MLKNSEQQFYGNVNELINEIEYFQNLGYIFRGHRSSKWILEPSAFRCSALTRNAGEYPIDNMKIIGEWFKDQVLEDELLRIVGKDPNGRRVAGNIFRLYVILMQYNYRLCNYYKAKCHVWMHDYVSKMRGNGEPEFWTKKETFISWLTITRLMNRYFDVLSIDGNLIFPRCPDNELTSLDETFPQHYGFETSALDWSLNPHKSLYFSVYDENEVAGINPDASLSLYAYKQLDKSSNLNQIMAPPIIDNPRATAQEGTFIYFGNACMFYAYHGRFPTMEDYHEEGGFSLMKLNLRRSEKNIIALQSVIPPYNRSKQN